MNVRQSELDDLLNDEKLFDVDGVEDVYTIDIDLIEKESGILAASQVSNLLALYNNKEFCDQHPAFKKRVDSEIESLRKLYKITKYNESMLDHLITTISNNPSNASLYAAADRLESKIMQADKEIKLILNEFNKLCTTYQTEINFSDNQPSSTSSTDSTSVTTRGTKAFIDEILNSEVN